MKKSIILTALCLTFLLGGSAFARGHVSVSYGTGGRMMPPPPQTMGHIHQRPPVHYTGLYRNYCTGPRFGFNGQCIRGYYPCYNTGRVNFGFNISI